MGLLREYDKNSIEAFSKDLFLVMNIIRNIDSEYAEGKQSSVSGYSQLKKLLKEWNKKYPILSIEHYEDDMQLKVKIGINGESLLNVVETATKIDNLVRINGNSVSLGIVDFKKFIDNNKRAELVYSQNEQENSLSFEVEKKAIKIIYSSKDIVKKDTPEFEICTFYGLKQYDSKINLQRFSTLFNFDTDLEASAGKGEGYLNRVKIFDRH